MSNTFKIIYSTLVVVLVVNSFVFALPIVANAQATEKQQIEQIQLTATQKAELAKAEKEAKLAMYKELGLSTAEKKFVEKYTVKLDSFNQAIDKYVNYNKTNGNATVDVTAIYKNMKAIRTATGLTQNEVLTVKDIALKLVKNYNKTVNSISARFSKTQAKLSINASQSNNEGTFYIEDRGVRVDYKEDSKIMSSNRSTTCYVSNVLIQSWWNWWGNSAKFVMNKCYAEAMLRDFNNGLVYSGVGAVLCAGLGLATYGTLGWVCAIVVGAYAASIQRNINDINYLKTYCRNNISYMGYSQAWNRSAFNYFGEYRCY